MYWLILVRCYGYGVWFSFPGVPALLGFVFPEHFALHTDISRCYKFAFVYLIVCNLSITAVLSFCSTWYGGSNNAIFLSSCDGMYISCLKPNYPLLLLIVPCEWGTCLWKFHILSSLLLRSNPSGFCSTIYIVISEFYYYFWFGLNIVAFVENMIACDLVLICNFS